MHDTETNQVINFNGQHPENILGLHFENNKYIIRAYLPIAQEAWIEIEGQSFSMHELTNKLFVYSGENKIGSYKISYRDESGYINTFYDPYNFVDLLSDYDLYLFRRGELYQSYKTFGAHLTSYNKVNGVRFVVWAPNAKAVSVVGNFNHWISGMNPMMNINDSGIFALFIPGLIENEVYKYSIKSKNDIIKMKTDPFAFYYEKRPRTSSIVVNNEYKWSDTSWINNNKRNKGAISIYEMHLGSWIKKDNEFYTYREIAEPLINYIKKLKFTHVEFLPLTEYPLDISWGYQAINYFSPTSRYGNPEDFKYLINELHKNNIGVIMDFVEAHFPDDDYGLSMFDGTHLFDYSDPRKGKTPDWGTNIFDFGKNEVRSFLISAVIFWIDVYHIDGIRMDAVTSMIYLDFSRKPGEWIPNIYGKNENLEAISFLTELNHTVHNHYKNVVTIAEESSSYNGITSKNGMDFNYKWNMGWMHDTLDFFSTDPLYRKFRISNLTFTIVYAYSEKYILPISHDEVVYGKKSLFSKMPGNDELKFKNIKLFLSYMFAYPGKKLLFMGSEFGQKEEWDVLNELHWEEFKNNEKIFKLLSDLNELYRNNGDFINDDDFSWVDFNDKINTVISFMRGNILCVFNFTPVIRENYCIGVDLSGKYKEILNTDDIQYNGSGILNKDIISKNHSMHNKNNSIEITLPSLGAIFIKRC